MSYRPYYSKGDWLALCDSCGRVVKASELRKRWDGMMVDDRCFETRHPQDFVRGIADVQTPPFSRPEPSEVFFPVCTLEGISAIAGLAVAGCSLVGHTYTDYTDYTLLGNQRNAIAGLAIAGFAIAGEPYSLSPDG